MMPFPAITPLLVLHAIPKIDSLGFSPSHPDIKCATNINQGILKCLPKSCISNYKVILFRKIKVITPVINKALKCILSYHLLSTKLGGIDSKVLVLKEGP